ncbi:MAG TPA: hypothetical protein VGN72_13795 [Tepidisphaeraceae bacterium]|jgi:hypothetical protein|nr:hypothetical protein [Tepidisphaeraceae bacterium]
MDLRNNELSRRDETGVTFATEARRAVWEFDGVTTQDGHTLQGAWSFSVAVPQDVHDRRMVVEVLMHDRDAVTVADVVRHFSDVLTRAATAHFATQTVTDALTEPAADHAAAALAKACEKMAFASGLEVLPPFDLRLRSTTLELANQRAAERSRAETDATERAEHLRRATELASVMASATALPPAFLQSIAPHDRPTALAAALGAGGQGRARTPLHIVAGRKLLQVDLTNDAANAVKLVREADEAIGALRCVQRIDGDRFALGGQRGVECFSDISADSTVDIYSDPQSTSPLGFNAIAQFPETQELWATHSQAGLVCWRNSELTAPVVRHGEYAGAGGLSRLSDGTHAFFAGSRVYVASPAGLREAYDAGDAIADLLPDGDRLLVLTDGGLLILLAVGTFRATDTRPTGGPIAAAATLPWLGGSRLLLARRDGGIDCLGLDDTLVTRYVSRHVGLRAVAASATHVAAITADRQRLVLWHAAAGSAPIAEINVAAQAGHRVAGMAFG